MPQPPTARDLTGPGNLPVGANYHPRDSEPATWRRDAAMMQEAGLRIVRLGLHASGPRGALVSRTAGEVSDQPEMGGVQAGRGQPGRRAASRIHLRAGVRFMYTWDWSGLLHTAGTAYRSSSVGQPSNLAVLNSEVVPPVRIGM